MAIARLGASLMPSTYCMPLTRWTSRSPATPVPYSFQQRQRAKHQGIEGPLGHGSLPGVPIERLRREIGRRRILPGSGGIVAAQRALHQHQVAEHSLRYQFLRLGADYGTDALRADLHDASVFFAAATISTPSAGGVRHGLFE